MQSGCQSGLLTSQGLPGAGKATSKLTQEVVGRKLGPCWLLAGGLSSLPQGSLRRLPECPPGHFPEEESPKQDFPDLFMKSFSTSPRKRHAVTSAGHHWSHTHPDTVRSVPACGHQEAGAFRGHPRCCSCTSQVSAKWHVLFLQPL